MPITDNIQALKEDIIYEREIIKEISFFINQIKILDVLEQQGFMISKEERKLLAITINSLMVQLKILNDSLPEIIEKISFFKELPAAIERKPKAKKEKLVSLKYEHPTIKENAFITIKKADRPKFLKELSLTDISVKRLKKESDVLREKIEKFKKPSIYAKISNKFFSNLSSSLINKGYFNKLSGELRKANLYFLVHTYISMAFFSSLIAFFSSIILFAVLLFFNLSFGWPFLTPTEDALLFRALKFFWLIIIIPALTFILFYFYPSTEKKSISGKINQELPFVLIHMSAIAGSGVEPTKMFKIIMGGKEYPNTKKEIKKFLNEINVYGYDIVTALRNSARVTSSTKFAEVLKGLATTITSGGSLKEFLDKRAETLIFNYKIEREKYNRTAETFMDIYISVVIAAPMIMTILLVMINLTGIPLGLSIGTITLLMILGIAVINVFFLIFLHLTQPAL